MVPPTNCATTKMYANFTSASARLGPRKATAKLNTINAVKDGLDRSSQIPAILVKDRRQALLKVV